MALMYDDDRSEMLFVIGVIIAVVIGITGFIFAMIELNEWTKENEARRCAEYGYHCQEDQSGSDSSNQSD